VPPPLRHEPFEVDEGKLASAQPSSQPPHSSGAVTPWIGGRSRISQAPMNRWTVLLLLVLARLLIYLDSLKTNLVSSKTKSVAACAKVEDVGSSIASMPHYLSTGVNRMAAEGITEAVRGLVEVLLMILTGVQQLIMFFIEIEVGLVLCFSTAIARAFLEVGEFAIEDATEALNAAVKTIAKDLNSAVSGLSSALDQIRKSVGSWGLLKPINVPQTNGLEDNLKKLDHISINTTPILKELKNVEQDINYDNVKNVAKEAIAVPFDMVKRLLNESYGTWEFDSSILPVPEKESLSLCSNSVLEDFFEALLEIAANARIISVTVLVFLAIVACATMAYWELRRFNRQRDKSERLTDRAPMDVVYVASRPFTAGTGLWVSEKLSGDRRRQFLIRWVVAYATTYTALFVLALSVAGAFSCLCQWVIMQAIQKETPALAEAVGDLASHVATSLEQASTKWANESNSIILEVQGDINDNMFGHVRDATRAANDTINRLDDAMHEGLSKAFGGVPPLEQFLDDVLGCLVGNKLESIQEGLAWVNEKARVTLPLLPDNVFSAGASDPTSDFNSTRTLSTPSSSVTGEVQEAANIVIDMLWSSIVQEVVISLVLFLIYLAYVLFAVAQAAIRMAMGERHVK
jgi:hypothetical protein